jgi:dienelactone hydrolase
MTRRRAIGVLAVVLLASTGVRADTETGKAIASEKGTVSFQPVGTQQNVPERYRLQAHTFVYDMSWLRDLPNCKLQVYQVRFPSPVTSTCPENNTVYAEYYRPMGKGPFPGVIVLDITAGDQSLSRTICNCLAQNQIAALFVQMAYYGPRRPPGSKLRLLSTNLPHTMDAIRQTVLDIRRASAWLEARPEIDRNRLGIHGTSLGSMVGALAAEMEPRLSRVSIALGGGGLVDAFYDHPRAARYRKWFELFGGKKELVARALAPIDPITCAANLKDRKVLLIAGKRDEIVPPSATKALWEAAGKPKLVWFDCSHYGAALYFVPIMNQVVKHFEAD